MINYQLCQKIKLLEKGEFNPLTIILTLPLTCRLKLPINKRGGGVEHVRFLTLKREVEWRQDLN